MARRPRVQVCKRSLLRACLFCGEADASTLDAHRVVPGSAYTWNAIIVCCASCHRKTHAGVIEVLGRYTDTLGRRVVRYREGGEEKWKVEAPAYRHPSS